MACSIFEGLASGEARTTVEIALAIKSNTSTVKKGAGLIALAQELPRKKAEYTRNVTLVRMENEGTY